MKRWAFLLGTISMGALWAANVRAQTESHKGGSHDGASSGVRTLPLPDNNAGDVSMDYIGYDPSTNSVWVPGGNTGAVDVVDAATGKVRQIPGFQTKEVEGRNGKRTFGPTAVSIGEGVVYIGNRGDSSVCAFEGSLGNSPRREGHPHTRRQDTGGKGEAYLRRQSRGICRGSRARPLLH